MWVLLFWKIEFLYSLHYVSVFGAFEPVMTWFSKFRKSLSKIWKRALGISREIIILTEFLIMLFAIPMYIVFDGWTSHAAEY